MVNRIPSNGIGGAEGEQLGMLDMPADERTPAEYIVVDTEAALEAMLSALEASEIVAFDTETTSQTAMLAELVGLSFSNEEGKGWYVPVGHEEGQQLGRDYVLERLRPMLESGKTGLAANDKQIALAASDKRYALAASDKRYALAANDKRYALAAHNANYDMTVLANYGINVEGIAFDTMIAAHLCGRTRTSIGLKPLALSLLHEDMTPIEDLIGRGRNQITMDKVEIAKAADYAAADAGYDIPPCGCVREGTRREQFTHYLRHVGDAARAGAGEDAEGRRCHRHGCVSADVNRDGRAD